MKPSELLQRIVKPESVLDRGALYELGRELDRMLGEGYTHERTLQATSESGVWRDWQPVLYQNGALVGTTITMARYKVDGEQITAQCRLVTTAVGAVGAVEIRGLPFACRYGEAAGGMIIYVGGVHRVGKVAVGAGGYAAQCVIDNNAVGAGATPAFALAIGNDIRMDIEYERQP